jgi:CSLREA domain-containing protein
MSRLCSALSLFAAAAILTTTLAGCRDATIPTRLLSPRSPLRTEVATAPVVNSLADDGDGTCTDTKCTLRDAIEFADASGTITFSVMGTITLAQGQLVISKSLTIQGPGAPQLAIDGNQTYRIFCVAAGIVAISDLTVRNGNGASGPGSPLCSAAPIGGGIMNFATLTLTSLAVSGNNNSGVANLITEGGGIYNASDGRLTVVASTISGNTSDTGGGIENIDGTATIINSTIAGNTAVNAGGVGNTGSMTVVNSTVAGNVGTSATGGVGDFRGQTLLMNTIVANNPDGGDCTGPITTDFGYNLADDPTCGFTAATSLSNTNAALDPSGLANNGGPTLTINLLAGSPAIDAIPFGTNLCGTSNTVDQRGTARPVNNRCDIGAVEVTSPGGFFPPINNVRTTPIHPGAGVPVQFTLGGDRGLAIFAAGSPSSTQIVCRLSDIAGEAIPTVTAGNSQLSYDASTDTYTYVWKTDKAWAGTCRRLVVTFADGSVRTADFSFDR